MAVDGTRVSVGGNSVAVGLLEQATATNSMIDMALAAREPGRRKETVEFVRNEGSLGREMSRHRSR